MRNSIRNRLFAFVSVSIVAVFLSITNFYSIGYILAVIPIAYVSRDFFVFKSFVQRYVLYLFTFIALIMVTGLVCWLLHTPMLPIYNIVAFMLLSTCLLLPFTKKTSAARPFVDRADITGIVVALVPIIIIAMSYLPSSSHSAALFQLASEGWDNGAHIIMMEDVSHAHGYVYGEKTGGNKPNSYPMGWHLASADFANGFGGNRFDPYKPIATIAAYMAVSVGWMVFACYLFILCTWRFYERVLNKKIKNISEIIPFVAVSLLVQMVVLYGSFASGFTNYIGSIVYLILLIAMVTDAIADRMRESYVLAILFGTISVLTWFLTFPAVALTILMLILLRSSSIPKSIMSTFRDWRFMTIIVLGFTAMVLQIYIFQKFAVAGGSSQLNAGVGINAFEAVVGVFPVNQILYGLMVGICIVWYFAKNTSSNLQKLILVTVLPWLLLVIGLFFYQNVTVGYTSYYLSKVLGLSLIATGVVSAVWFSLWVNKYVGNNHPRIVAPLTALMIVVLTVIATGQSTYGLNKLFQKNARTHYATAVETASLLETIHPDKEYIIVLTNRLNSDGSFEDDHGKLELRVTHQRRNCTYRITGYQVTLKTSVNKLGACADKLKKKNKSIIVVTSDLTEKQVKALDRSNITIHNVADHQFNN